MRRRMPNGVGTTSPVERRSDNTRLPVIDPVTLARTWHGHLGLLAAIALLHPAITLRGAARLRPGTRWSVAGATALVTAATGLGWWLYPGYREADKPRLLQEAFPVALLFETKEHLAFYALALAWGGCGLALATEGARARRAARFCFGAASALAITTGVLGAIVGSAAAG